MNVLFSLDISCITKENYWVEHHIGLFKSTEAIEEATQMIMSKGGRFSGSDYEVRISEIEVVGELDNIECVYRFYGQNLDASFEGDIIESPCYTDKAIAIQQLMKAKKCTPRQYWNLESHTIGKCNC